MLKAKRSKDDCADILTPKQFDLLNNIVELADNNVQAYVCLYTAALRSQLTLKEAQHIVYALLEAGMLDEFTNKMKVSITNRAVIYCYHNQHHWILKFCKKHTEALIRGAFGVVGAILGALATLIAKALFLAGKL